MPVTRIKNNQITDLTVNAAAKLQDYTVTATKIANNLTYGSDLTVAGNLTVQGNTTTIDTVNVVVEDPLILLAAAQTGAPTLDIGFIGKRGTSDNITFVWDETQGLFVTAFTNSEVTNTTVNINSYASFKTLDNIVTGNLDVTGTSSLTGNLTIGNLSVDPNKVLDMGNNVVSNIAEPVANSDAATKSYVDSVASSGFTIEDDTANTTIVSGGDTVQFLGTTNEVTVEITDVDQLTFGLPDDVVITANLSANTITSTTSINGATGSFTGNVVAGNVDSNAAVNAVTVTASGNLNGNNAVITNDVSATTGTFSGNVLAANVNSNASVTGVTVTASGNLNGNNAVITNDVSAVTGTFSGNVIAANVNSNAAVTGVTITASGNLNGNNAVITNGVSAVTGTFSGNISANNATVTNDIGATNITASGNVNGGNVNTNNIVGTAVTITSTGNITITSTTDLVDFSGAVLKNLGTPVDPTDATTKQYVDEVAQGLDVKASVVYATATALPAYTYNNGTAGAGATITANANGALSIDGATPAQGDRVLVKNEAGVNQPYNGIYVVTTVGSAGAPFVLTRSTDFDNETNIPGAFTFVEQGSTNADTGWVCTTDQPVTVGTTNIVWTQFSGAGQYIAGNGLSLTGTTFDVNVDNDTTWINPNDQVAVKPSANLVTPNIGNATGNSLTLSGNGLLSATTVEASGNVLAGNVNSNAAVTGVTVTASGNLNGNNAVITNDVSATTGTFSGNVLAANVNSNAAVTGVTVTASGNLNGNNAVITNDVSATTGTFSGNVIAANVNSNAAVTGVTITASGNLNGNNAVITNDVSATTGTFSGNVIAANVDSNAAVNAVTVTASGNLNGNNAVITNDVSATTGTFSGNVIAANVNSNAAVTGVTITASGNLNGNNAVITNDVSATTGTFSGNISANNATVTNDIGATNITASGNVNGGNVNTDNIVGTAVTITSTGNVTVASTTDIVDFSGAVLKNLGTPIDPTDATTKQYVDEVAQGLDVKASVQYATAAALPNYTYNNGTAGVGATITADFNGALSIDGATPAQGARVLVKNETAGNQPYNGIYVVTTVGDAGTPFVLTRSTDFDQGAEVPGAFTFVEQGSTQADTGWVCTTDQPVTIGTTNIIWTQFSGAGQYSAGNGLSLTGTTFDVNVDNDTTWINLNDQVAVKPSANLVTPNIGNATGNSLTLSGNGLLSATTVEATGNVLAGNVNSNAAVTGVTITASGNLNGNNAVITNDVSATTGTFSGNVIAANVNSNAAVTGVTITASGNLNGNNAIITNDVSATTGTFSGNVIAANVNSNAAVTGVTITASGNLNGNNAVITNDVSATTGTFSGNVLAANVNSNAAVTGVTVTASGNLNGNNAVITNDVSATTGTFSGNVIAANIDSNAAVNAVTVTASGNLNGNNAVITNDVGATSGTFTANVSANNAVITNDISATTGTFSGNVLAANVNSNAAVTGVTITASGNLNGNNAVITNDVSAVTGTFSGNVIAANVNSNAAVTGVTITASGNINGNNAVITNDVGATSGTFTGNVSANNAVITNNVGATNITATGNVNGANVNTNSIVGTEVTIKSTGNLIIDTTANVDFGGAVLKNIGAPVDPTDATTKQYVDEVAQGLDVKASVVYATAAALPAYTYNNGTAGVGATITANANGALSIDGNTPAVNDRILVKDEAGVNQPYNGIYVVTTVGDAGTPFVLTRSNDFDNGSPSGEIPGAFTFVETGTVNADTGWVCTTNQPVTMGTTNIVWTQFSGAGSYTAGNGISLIGTSFNVNIDNDTTWINPSNEVAVKPSANLTTPNIGNATGNSLTLSGNGLLSATTVEVTGNVLAGNVNSNAAVTGVTITASGNLNGNNAVITNDVSATTGTFSGNVIAANVNSNAAVTGVTITASGNLNGNNAIITNDVSATTGTFSGNVIAANVNSNAAVTGVTITASGNLNGNNAVITNDVSATTGTFSGNVIAANVDSNAAVNAVTITASGNLNGNNAVITNDVGATSGTFTANVSANNAVITNDVSATTGTFSGNVLAGNVNSNAAVTGITITASGNLEGNNAVITNDVSAVTGTFSGNVIAANVNSNAAVTGVTITASGNLNGNNAVITNDISATTGTFTGNVTADKFIGNIDAGGSNTQIQFNDTGDVLAGSPGLTFDKTSNLVTVSGNVDAANFNTTGQGLFGNIAVTGDTINGLNGIININGAGTDTDFAVNGDTNANVFYVDAGTETVSIGSSAQTTDAALAINTTNSMLIPVGNTAQRPAVPVTGMVRFNTTTNYLEFYDNNSWETAGSTFTVISNETFNGDGSTVAFTLSQAATTASVIVSINGVVQLPTTAYGVVGTTLTFTEAPVAGDVIDVRLLTTTTTVTSLSGTGGGIIEGSAVTTGFDVTGNLLPSAHVTYDLGSENFAWRDLWLSGTTIRLGNIKLSDAGGALAVTTSTGTPTTIDTPSIKNGTSNVTVTANGNINMSVAGTPNVMTVSSTGTTINGDLTVTGNATLTGNIVADKIMNGTSSIEIPASGSNAIITINGTANVAVFSTTGANITGDMTVSGNVTAQDVNSLSDMVLKTNIQPLSGVTGVIQSLTGVEYDWKNGSGHSYGFLAQEVEKVLPSAVKTGENGLKSINYMMIIPFLVETIKQMGDEIQDLKRTVQKRRGKKN